MLVIMMLFQSFVSLMIRYPVKSSSRIPVKFQSSHYCVSQSNFMVKLGEITTKEAIYSNSLADVGIKKM